MDHIAHVPMSRFTTMMATIKATSPKRLRMTGHLSLTITYMIDPPHRHYLSRRSAHISQEHQQPVTSYTKPDVYL